MNISEFAENNQDKAAAELLQRNLSTGLKNISDVWSYHYPSERQKIRKLLINKTQISDKGLKIKMNLDGFKKVLMELG